MLHCKAGYQSAYMAFNKLKYVPSILGFFRTFYHAGMLNLLKAPFAKIEIIMWLLSLMLFIWRIIFSNLHIESSLHTWNEANLIMMYNLFIVLWNMIWKYSEFSYLHFINENGLQFSIFVIFLTFSDSVTNYHSSLSPRITVMQHHALYSNFVLQTLVCKNQIPLLKIRSKLMVC